MSAASTMQPPPPPAPQQHGPQPDAPGDPDIPPPANQPDRDASARWFKVPADFVRRVLASVATVGEVRVLMALMSYANSEGLAWPSIKTLAVDTRLDRGSVSRVLLKLVEAGKIERVSPGRRDGTTTRYRLLVGSCWCATGGTETLAVQAQQRSCSGATPVAADAHQPSCPGAAGVAADAHQPSCSGAAQNRPLTDKANSPKEKKAPAAKLPSVPPALATPEFLAAWGDFIQHRIERKPKLTPTAAKHALSKCEHFGAERATAAIRHSIACGYQGIFEPSQQLQRRYEHARKPTAAERGQFPEDTRDLPELPLVGY